MNNCEHKIEWNNIKIMTYPNIKFGYCTICGKTCREINNKIIWED